VLELFQKVIFFPKLADEFMSLEFIQIAYDDRAVFETIDRIHQTLACKPVQIEEIYLNFIRGLFNIEVPFFDSFYDSFYKSLFVILVRQVKREPSTSKFYPLQFSIGIYNFILTKFNPIYLRFQNQELAGSAPIWLPATQHFLEICQYFTDRALYLPEFFQLFNKFVAMKGIPLSTI